MTATPAATTSSAAIVMTAVAVVAALATVIGPNAAAAAPARAWMSYTVSAEAAGIRVDTDIPAAPGDDRIAAAEAPRARAAVDGLGTSAADAAAVAPGDTLRSLHGIAANLATGPLPMSPVPAMPLVAESSHPTVAEKKIAQPPVVLHARSTQTTSTGSAGWDATASSGLTVAAVSGAADATLQAAATTEVVGFAVGSVAIGRITSTVAMERRPGGEATHATELAVTGLTVNGASVDVGPHRAFTSKNVAIRYLEADETDGAVVAPGLAITITLPQSFADDPSVLTYTLGRAEAELHATPAPDRPTISPEGLTPPASPQHDEPEGKAPDAGSTIPPSSPVAPRPVGSTLEPELALATPDLEPAVAAPFTRPHAPVLAADIRPWSAGWYLPLIAVAASLTAALIWFRRAGVRGTWT